MIVYHIDLYIITVKLEKTLQGLLHKGITLLVPDFPLSLQDPFPQVVQRFSRLLRLPAKRPPKPVHPLFYVNSDYVELRSDRHGLRGGKP